MKVITEEQNTDIIQKQRLLLMAVILFIPFNQFPISFPLAGGVLSFLCLFIGYVFFVYEICIQGTRLSSVEKWSFAFLTIVVIWAVITGILGILNFPYFSWVSLNQLDGFQNFYNNISNIIPVNELIAIKACLSYREIRTALLNIISTYLISVWVYHLYRNNWQQAFFDLRKILLILCACLAVYSVFEVDYLIGGVLGKSVLETINPLYMKIATSHGWWPPLLWHGQLRSLFDEPSYFGIFLSMAVPILISYFYSKKLEYKSYFGITVYFALVIMLVLSQARTGNILFIGELLLLSCWQIGIYRKQWKRFCALIIGTCFAFFIGLGILSQFYEPQSWENQGSSVGNYLQQNVNSVVGNQRSNSARSANVKATAQVGAQHPVFGVGISLKSMYIDKNLSIDDKNVPEVGMWSKYMYEKGPIKSGYPTLNQLSGVFSEQGIIGVLLFVFPIGIIIGKLFKKKYLLKKADVTCMSITLCGLCGAFFSNADMMIPYYLVIGYMLIIVFSDGRQNDE